LVEDIEFKIGLDTYLILSKEMSKIRIVGFVF